MAVRRAEFRKQLQESVRDHHAQIFGRVNYINPSQENERIYSISISLINEFMFKADSGFYYFLSENDLPVRPRIPLYENEDNEIDEGDEVKESKEETERDYLVWNYYPYVYEFVTETINKKEVDYLRELEEGWYKVDLFDLEDGKSPSEGGVVGTTLFGASPLISSSNRLVFNKSSKNDTLCKKLDVFYTEKNLGLIVSKFHNRANNLNKFSNLIPDDIKIVNGVVRSVGMANNMILEMKGTFNKSCTILYDLGKTHIPDVLSRTEINNNINSFKHDRFNAVVLSHWDLDHILAVGDYNPKLLYSSSMVWVVPDIMLLNYSELTISAVRLACYISGRSTAYFSDNLNKELAVGNRTFKIFQGKGAAARSASHQNNIGLLIEMIGDGNYTVFSDKAPRTTYLQSVYNHPGAQRIGVLLCGDCVYDNFPDVLPSEKYNIFGVPHHGTYKADPDKLIGVNDGVAIICADDSKYEETYPGDNHVLGLLKKGYNHIYVTKESGNVYFNIVFH